jgi:outer membrane lipoprotein-sorting protein
MCFGTHPLVLAAVCWTVIASCQAQSSQSSPDALSLLQKASQQYLDVKTYKIIQEQTFSSEHPPDPAPTVMTAIEAPSHRYRFEADVGLGNDVRVSDGQFVWLYRPSRMAYTKKVAAVNDAKPEASKAFWPDEMGLIGASHLRDMARFAADYKAAVRLSDANLILRGHWFECYVIELSNEDLKTPRPYPFTETVWIEKQSFKIRKIVENYIATLQTGMGPPITFPATRVSIYPEVVLNEPIPDAVFQFTPPTTAHLVSEFSDQLNSPTETRGLIRFEVIPC